MRLYLTELVLTSCPGSSRDEAASIPPELGLQRHLSSPGIFYAGADDLKSPWSEITLWATAAHCGFLFYFLYMKLFNTVLCCWAASTSTRPQCCRVCVCPRFAPRLLPNHYLPYEWAKLAYQPCWWTLVFAGLGDKLTDGVHFCVTSKRFHCSWVNISL